MMLDRCLGLLAMQDLLSLAGDYLDQVKLSFGTALLLDQDLLRRKVETIRSEGISVFPGGTLSELTLERGMFSQYVNWAQGFGFDALEISDGILEIPRSVRNDAIDRALDAGLEVLTEVGKKDPRLEASASFLCDQIETDLARGAQWVIIEARESGRGVGIYGADGQMDEAKVTAILKQLGENASRLIWEAPRSSQQVALIGKCGVNVNLGNIKPRDVLGLEALRCGLRYETFLSASEACSELVEEQLTHEAL
ncbi:MAG: phosphosulfolactate synthase [Deltaproteobacteria bacterium]|nr:phosphosulfolactate synthase [Deltaproteobacteria bacterium]